jgi:hypothetical protein
MGEMSGRKSDHAMLRRLCRSSLLCGCVCAGLLVGPAVAPALAKEAEVTFGGGAVAMKNESAYIEMLFTFFGHAECSARDNLASVGKNPSKTVKVTGSNKPLASTRCENEVGTANGGVRVASVSVTSTGKVSAKLGMAVELSTGCKYELKKMSGTIASGGIFGIGTLIQADLQKGVSQPANCTKSISGEGEILVGDLTFEQLYHVSFV